MHKVRNETAKVLQKIEIRKLFALKMKKNMSNPCVYQKFFVTLQRIMNKVHDKA